MKTTIKCYEYSPADEPFLVFDVKTVGDMIHELGERISWRKYPNEIFVKIGSENCILYFPMLHQFKDWNGNRWINISYNRVYHYFTR